MNDYIRRGAALIELDKLKPIYALGYDPKQVWDMLINQPAADVMPVVFCRNCRCFDTDSGHCFRLDIWMNENDFCSRGEKPEGGAKE